MDKLESMRAFVIVAKTGGFSAAARDLGLPVPTVSRKVAELESALGVRLFERSTRQVVLTDQAQGYFATCQRLLEDLRDAEEAISDEHRSPKGELAVTAPVGFGRLHVRPVAQAFLRDFPEVNMRLQLVDRVVSLLDEQVDVAVRISALPDSSLVAKQLGEIRMVVCASPSYLEQHGVPSHPRELAGHDCIAWASLGPLRSWLFQEQGDDMLFPIRVRLATTLPESAVEAAVGGIGLTQVTSYQAAQAVREGRLVPVLRAFEAVPTPVSLVYPSRRLAPQKLRSFVDFVAPRLSARLADVSDVL